MGTRLRLPGNRFTFAAARVHTDMDMAERPGMRDGSTFAIDVAREADGRSVVVVSGDVDLHSGPELRDRLADLVEDEPRQVVIDLTDATFLDSMALGVLLGAKRDLAARDARLDVVVSNPDLQRVFEITMLDRVFDLHESRAALHASDGDGTA